MSSRKKILLSQDHVWELPLPPRSQDDVLFAKENVKNQYWRRDNDFPQLFFDYHIFAEIGEKTDYNDEGILTSISVKDAKKILGLVDREMRRRWEGVWFMNDGELTWLSPGHYFMLQWGKMPDFKNKLVDYDSAYGYYREDQRDLHYFLQMCKEDDDCGGAFIGKAKKTGVTQLLSIDYVDESTKYREKRFGMMSKSQDDCKRTNFMYYEYALDGLPLVFRPQIAHSTQTLIRFDNPKRKSTGTRNATIQKMQLSNGFNSEVFAAGTVKDAFDGPKMFRGWLDEFPKYEAPYPQEVLESTSETVKMGSRIDGKLWLSSYPPEKDERGFKEAAKVWYDSINKNPITRRTPTGLYTYFVSALDASDADFDRNGRCDRRKVQVFIDATRNQYKHDSQKLQAFTRQYPVFADEMWIIGGGGNSTFDNLRIGKQKFLVEDELKHNLPYEEGWLEWEGPKLLSKVKFIPRTDEQIMANIRGTWILYGREYWNPDTLNLPMTLYLNKIEKELRPFRDSTYAAAWDPVDYAEAADVTEGSKNGCLVESDFSLAQDTYYGKHVSDQICAEYLNRFNNPLDDLDELIKMMLFFGCHVYIETNKPWVFTTLKQMGLASFAIVREPGVGLVPYNAAKHQKLPATTDDVIADYVKAIMIRLAEPEEGQTDHLSFIKSIRVLNQLMVFNPKKTKKTDLAVAYGLLRLFKDARAAIRLKEMLKRQQNQDNGMGIALRHLVGFTGR